MTGTFQILVVKRTISVATNRNPFVGKWDAIQIIKGKENIIATMSFKKDLTLVTTSNYMKENTKNDTEHNQYKFTKKQIIFVSETGNEVPYLYTFQDRETFTLDGQFKENVVFKRSK